MSADPIPASAPTSIPTPVSEQVPTSIYLDALRSLYEGQLGTLRVLSERSFTTTLQALALNVVVVAGLVGGKTNLSLAGKLIGSGVLIAFNAAIAIYLVSKSRAHHREKKKLAAIEKQLAALANWPYGKGTQAAPSYWRAFLGGSGLMVLAVVVAGACASLGLWVTLIQHEAAEDISVVIKSVPPTSAASTPKGSP